MKLLAITNYGFTEIIKKGFKKYIFRLYWMGKYVVTPKECIAPTKGCSYAIEIWGPDKYGEILKTSPHLTQEDIDEFDKCTSKCVVVFDKDNVIASLWMVRGEHYIRELGQTMTFGDDEYYSTRAYVHYDYRGEGLFGHMKTYFLKNYALPNEKVISFVMNWNIPSIKSNIKIGCRHEKDVGFITLFGLKWRKDRFVK